MVFQEITFERGYEIGLTPAEIATSWSHLERQVNFGFTSVQTWDYNCVMWSLNIDDDWKDFFYTEDGYVSPDQSINPYINFFKERGFQICENGELEPGQTKICIYSKNGIFSHVSRLMENGRWASKMGNYEDIEHLSEFDVSGIGYGKPETYMKKAMAT